MKVVREANTLVPSDCESFWKGACCKDGGCCASGSCCQTC